MKKATLVTCIFAALFCIISGCSRHQDGKNPPSSHSILTTQTLPGVLISTSPTKTDKPVLDFRTIISFVDKFNNLAPSECQFENYTISQENDSYIISTPEGYSAVVLLDQTGEVINISVRDGTFYQKINTAKTAISILYPENKMPADKIIEIDRIKQQVFEIKAQIQKQIQENENAELDVNKFAISDLSQQAEELLLQIEKMKEELIQ